MLWSQNYKNIYIYHFKANILYLTVRTCISCPPSSLCMLWQLVLPKPSQSFGFQLALWKFLSPWRRSLEQDTSLFLFFLLTPFLCQPAVKSQFRVWPHFSIWSDIVVEKYKCLPASLQVFVSQLKCPTGQSLSVGLNCSRCSQMRGCRSSTNPPPHLRSLSYLFDVVEMKFS